MISEIKYQILRHCNIVPCSPQKTAEALGTDRKKIAVIMLRLVEDELMTSEDGLYLTASEGRIEARIFRDAASRVVPAPKIDKFEGKYETPKNVFYRNNGNAHIARRGVPC